MFNQIASNTAAQLVAKFVGVGLTLLTTVLIIRLGGPNLFGDLTKSLALIAIGFTAIDFGLNAAAVRSMGRDAASQTKFFSDTLLVRFILSLLAVIILNGVVWLLPGGYTEEVKRTFFVGSLAIIFHGFYISANTLFQRRLSYWRSTLAIVVGTVIGTALTYLVVTTSPTLFNLLAVSTIGYFFAGGISILQLGKFDLSFSLARAWRHFRASFWLGATLIASILASRMDTVILGIFRSSVEVGYYGLSYRAFEVALTLPTFAMNAIFPLLLDLGSPAKERLLKRSGLFLFAIGILGIVVLYFAAPLLSLIRPGLESAVATLRILSFSLPLFYLTSPLMWSLIERRREKILLAVYLCGALANAALNLSFTPRFGLTSAAIITGVTELFILLSLLYYSRKHS